MRCEYCDSELHREEYQKILGESGVYLTEELVCPQCGAALLSYDNTLATFCNFCGSFVEFTHRTTTAFKPDRIVPFKIKKPIAVRLYQERINQALFAPDWLSEDGSISTTGIYMPYYVYDIDAIQDKCKVFGKEEIEHGNSTTVKDYCMEFDLYGHYEGMRFDAVQALPDALSESIDNFTEKGQPFESSYLAGYYADSDDVNPQAYEELVHKLIGNDLRGMNISYRGISFKTGSIQPDIYIKKETTLMPVYLTTHKHGDRVCYAAVNGQTGKVAADIPIDKTKYLKASGIVASVLALLMNLIFTFTPAMFLFLSLIVLTAFGFMIYATVGDVYAKEHNGDNLGVLDEEEFYSIAQLNNAAMCSKETVPGISTWKYKVPFEDIIKVVYPFFIGLGVSLLAFFLGSFHDVIYYAAGIINIGLAVFSSFIVIDQQNKLTTRDIPAFTMERGGTQEHD